MVNIRVDANIANPSSTSAVIHSAGRRHTRRTPNGSPRLRTMCTWQRLLRAMVRRRRKSLTAIAASTS